MLSVLQLCLSREYAATLTLFFMYLLIFSALLAFFGVLQPGDAAAFGMEKLEAYLTTRAGKYCDIAEKLVYNHLRKGDQVRACLSRLKQ
jgi:hypothetical protein